MPRKQKPFQKHPCHSEVNGKGLTLPSWRKAFATELCSSRPGKREGKIAYQSAGTSETRSCREQRGNFAKSVAKAESKKDREQSKKGLQPRYSLDSPSFLLHTETITKHKNKHFR